MSEIEKYKSLISKLVTGEIAVPQFEVAYLEMFKNESSEFSEDVYDALNKLFTDVDSYCGDPVLRDDEDLTDEELLGSAKDVLNKLMVLL